MLCEERGQEWWDISGYRAFINHLRSSGFRMQKFPLCIKESGGTYERGRDKTKFLDELSKIASDDASAYTIKLSNAFVDAIRSFPGIKTTQQAGS
jgi:hypothetical protein